MIEKYSPNTAWGKQHIEIVLMQWDYKRTIAVDVGGNCTGMSVLDCAIGVIYDSTLSEDEEKPAEITLFRDDGSHLICTDEEEDGDDWLKKMVVSACITGWTPPTLNEVRKMNGARPVKDGNRPWSPDGAAALSPAQCATTENTGE